MCTFIEEKQIFVFTNMETTITSFTFSFPAVFFDNGIFTTLFLTNSFALRENRSLLAATVKWHFAHAAKRTKQK